MVPGSTVTLMMDGSSRRVRVNDAPNISPRAQPSVRIMSPPPRPRRDVVLLPPMQVNRTETIGPATTGMSTAGPVPARE